MPYYLYGHYDSRGGATLLEAPTKREADLRYIEEVGGQTIEDHLKDAAAWKDDEHAAEFWRILHEARNDRDKVIELLVSEDFIAEVNLESYRELRDGEDLEYGEDHWPNENNQRAEDFEAGLQWAEPEVQVTTANPHKELLWWNEETKTLRLEEPGRNPGDPPEDKKFDFPPIPRSPGWKRSEFGEDACGVVLMRLPTAN
jgi:hypothetical protein